tara:strand:+ start:97 stop:507 length:411 start_codon:yes stop_codon:yes gene_type:complete
MAAMVLSGHVTALTAASLALCCFSHAELSEPGDQCPLHLGASEPSPAHAAHRSGGLDHEAHGQAADASPVDHHAHGDDCQMRCNEELTPSTALGPPALMTTAILSLPRPPRAERVGDLAVGVPTVPPRIDTPPPRV